MNKKIKLILVTLCALELAGCMTYEEASDDNYRNYVYNDNRINTQFTGYDAGITYRPEATSAVSVPDSYHVGEYHSPVSFKDRDRNWVSNQNPQGYTIEVADDEKASLVANKLYKTPKNDRMAQVKYQRDGKDYYKGVYGNYPDAQSAQKALDALPAEIKQGAGVKNWGSVQQNLE